MVSLQNGTASKLVKAVKVKTIINTRRIGSCKEKRNLSGLSQKGDCSSKRVKAVKVKTIPVKKYDVIIR